MDSLEIPPSGDSQLLSESPQFSLTSVGSSSRTGPGGDDLSLSELYPDNPLPQRPAQARRDNPKTRPSIAQALGFGAPIGRSQGASASGVPEEEEGEGWRDVTVRAGEDVDPTHLAAQSREEKLRSDLFVLRQLNGAFAAYNDALRETQAGTEVSLCSMSQSVIFDHPSVVVLRHKRVAKQLEQTDALLNKYINILSKSERVTQLIFDERWTGAEADEALLEEEIRAEEEKRRREEEERKLAAQREKERREKEELERALRDEAERLERERRDKMAPRSTSGVRGVRGTRASMRARAGARGVSSAISASSTVVGNHTRASSGTAPGPSKIARPSSSASSSRGTSLPRGTSKRP
ncbi:hypothetical protein EDB92DRAFT_1941334 [Lactarius akahatsu]|uniref:DASH complex subunit DUO1 n=1 Tax=Lactarius akahatsu TaxID=416441 RepID=A0AAD4QGX8_9AGAM|nr:hypothetical protein EDB92DRAFT_1941334 [Lactarius akahatsu]